MDIPPEIPPEQSLITYPSDFPIKVMGANVDGFVTAMTHVARAFDPAFDASTIELRPSKAGNYLGVTLTVHVTSREQLDELYRTLTTHPMVKIVFVNVRPLGRVAYAPTCEAMQAFTAARTADTPDELWVCEHPPVFTQGLAGREDHLLAPGDIPVVPTNRGGQVTYHGPGQVVAYPLVDLQRAGYFVKEYVYRVEEAVIRTLGLFGVTGHRVAGAPGIYVRLDDPGSHALLPQRPQKKVPGEPALPPDFGGLGKIAALGIKGQPPLHLPRGGIERGHGPATLPAHQPLRLRRPANGRSFYNRGCRFMG